MCSVTSKIIFEIFRFGASLVGTILTISRDLSTAWTDKSIGSYFPVPG